MKILLVGFKLSIGNELYMQTLYKHFTENDCQVDICGDSNYVLKHNQGYSVANGGNSKQMILDTINPYNWFKFYKILQNDYDKIFFISSHTLNNIAIVLAKFKGVETISHIHDPIPHSGTKYGWIILLSQKLQSRLTDKIIVYGKKLQEIIHREYSINNNKIYEIKHGVYRDDKELFNKEDKKYISLLGRIDEYKGIDIFLDAIEKLDNKINKDIIFIIGGKGDLTSYEQKIAKLKHRLEIYNYIISNDKFDEILQQSYMLVLPYKDGTQTGNIQVAYYNATPVIVTDVGSIPELVEEGKTGYTIEPNNSKELYESIEKVLAGDYEKMGKNSFEYYKKYLRWKGIIKNLIKIFEDK